MSPLLDDEDDGDRRQHIRLFEFIEQQIKPMIYPSQELASNHMLALVGELLAGIDDGLELRLERGEADVL